jgi:hypothetical protein
MFLSLHWLTQPLQLAWGPLSFLAVVGILRDWHSRHVVQVIVCTAHVYGVALYYLTNWNESRVHGVAYSRPETLYFWVYYVGFNLPWAVVPLGELYFLIKVSRLTSGCSVASRQLAAGCQGVCSLGREEEGVMDIRRGV